MSSEFIELKMPDVSPSGLAVMEMVSDENFDILKLSKAISQDPVLSSIVLKYANAPIYRSLVEITNVRQAISILGLKNVRMAVVVATMRSFDKGPNKLAQIFWNHSFAIATLCRLLAKKVVPHLAEDIELTGLLHEMGALVLLTNFKQQYQEVVDTSLRDGIDLEDVEKQVFGVNHNELLTRLLSDMRLPEMTFYAINDLADMDTVELLGRDVDYHMAIVALAHHILFSQSGAEQHPTEHMPDNLASLSERLSLKQDDIEKIVAEFELSRP
ncbi:MAG: HDOD domain-containing protein [Gammaproteobacteria bacterium]|nr:HDOD domain-containing protein [Gammaproteobacteria bacterium]